MADPFLFQDELPPLSFEPDEKALAQAKYLAALRGGLGLIDREPLGRAGQGAINTYLGAHEDARRQQLAQQQLMMQRAKLQNEYQEDMRKAMFIKQLDENTLLAAGVPKLMIDAVKSSKDPAAAVLAMNKFFERRTSGPGQVDRNWTGAVENQTPDAQGFVTEFDKYGNPIGRRLLPGASAGARELSEATASGGAQYDFIDVPVPGDPTKTQRVSKAQLRAEEQARRGAVPAGVVPPEVAAATAAARAAQPERDARRVTILVDELQKAIQEGRKQDEIAIRKELSIIGSQVRNTAGNGAPSVEKFSANGPRISDPIAAEKARREMEQRTRPPSEGMEWTDETRTGQRPIPGGPKDTSVKDAGARTRVIEQADNVLQQVESAIGDVGIGTTGFVGSVASKIPGTSAANLHERIDSIAANIGFMALQAMRKDSPTGGALGQVAIQELEMLQKTLSSLKQVQSPDQLREGLRNVKTHFVRLKDTMRKEAALSPGATGGWGDGMAENDPLGIRGR